MSHEGREGKRREEKGRRSLGDEVMTMCRVPQALAVRETCLGTRGARRSLTSDSDSRRGQATTTTTGEWLCSWTRDQDRLLVTDFSRRFSCAVDALLLVLYVDIFLFCFVVW